MGWMHDNHEGHEGYIVGLVEEGSVFRELGYPSGEERQRLNYVSVGCDCGWRSLRLVAPARAEWVPFCVETHDEDFDERARALWLAHVESTDDVFDTLARVWLRRHGFSDSYQASLAVLLRQAKGE